MSYLVVYHAIKSFRNFLSFQERSGTRREEATEYECVRRGMISIISFVLLVNG